MRNVWLAEPCRVWLAFLISSIGGYLIRNRLAGTYDSDEMVDEG
jgi:hypothetical protein